MPAEQGKLLQRAMAPCLKSAGFLKQGATWRRASPSTIAVLNLQGSQWGPAFYVNLGIYLRELGAEERPAERRCHVRLRAGQLMMDPRRFH